ncbi:hypothetical protein ANSO36C_01330 [Nostoc cf. commune SO-36]|uniref:Uncharacterized protein n=1 Tax=Nostoc cf. commune SO-36 TaxID=449208 RepID=A0ABM7YUM6_NOSCO|nr:hypothetical protein ANSO36C_01330 [Nostoc cf. commune SO-36]
MDTFYSDYCLENCFMEETSELFAELLRLSPNNVTTYVRALYINIGELIGKNYGNLSRLGERIGS